MGLHSNVVICGMRSRCGAFLSYGVAVKIIRRRAMPQITGNTSDPPYAHTGFLNALSERGHARAWDIC